MKVVKFGGSSMADAGQYRKIRDILLADPERRVVIVSAAGKAEKAVKLIMNIEDQKEVPAAA
jgi:aspartate kinase